MDADDELYEFLHDAVRGIASGASRVAIGYSLRRREEKRRRRDSGPTDPTAQI